LRRTGVHFAGKCSALRRATTDDLAAVTALQQAAYAKNRPLLGVEPLPLTADYAAVFSEHEIWLADGARGLDGVLILQARADHLLIWSVATAPAAQGSGVGNRLLAFAEAHARGLGLRCIRLYTGEPLTGNIAWYQRHGYVYEHTEQMPDRRLVHLIKHLE
jgi:ribosomal protein S18 acetylase RimI-like enzyme